MPLTNVDIGHVAAICQQHRCRVRYGVLGAAISTRVGNPNALPQNYARATVTMLNTFFGGRGPTASWVVGDDGRPTGYRNPPNPLYDTNWTAATPIHDRVDRFLAWLDTMAAGWDNDLRSTYP